MNISMLLAEFSYICAGGATIGLASSKTVRSLLRHKKSGVYLHDYIPLHQLQKDSCTIECGTGIYTNVIAVSGLSQSFLKHAERHHLFDICKKLIDQLSEHHIQLRAFTFRDRVTHILDKQTGNEVVDAMIERWNHHSSDILSNEHYLVVNTKKGGNKETLKQAVATILQLLEPYTARILYQKNAGELSAFWSRLTSPVSRFYSKGTTDNIAESITADAIEFLDEGGVVASYGSQKKWIGIFSIKKLDHTLSTGLIEELTSTSFPLHIYQGVEIHDALSAVATLSSKQATRVDAANDKEAVAHLFKKARDKMEEDSDERSAMVAHSLSVFTYGESLLELEEQDFAIQSIFRKYGFVPVREGILSEQCYFSQFPGYALCRTHDLFSENIATLLSFEKEAAGLPASQWLDEPITCFTNAKGGAYKFQFHISNNVKEETGHGVVFGATGSGKTTFVHWLAIQALKHPSLQIFSFDRFEGAYTISQAVGGHYVYLDGSDKNCLLNPLQLEDTEYNRAFLVQWLALISECYDPKSIEEITYVLELLYAKPVQKRHRNLRHIVSCVDKKGAFYQGIQKWLKSPYDMFLAEQDTLDIQDGRWFSFDFTTILRDQKMTEACVMYITHRIKHSLRDACRPALIIIDETASMLKNPVMRKWYEEALQEYRKLNACVWSLFQRPNSVQELDLGGLIRGQKPNKLFFPFAKAKKEEFTYFGLSETEAEVITGNHSDAKKMTRPILLQRPDETVLLEADLSCLGHYLSLFGGQSTVQKMKVLQATYGADEGVTRFLQEGEECKNVIY